METDIAPIGYAGDGKIRRVGKFHAIACSGFFQNDLYFRFAIRDGAIAKTLLPCMNANLHVRGRFKAKVSGRIGDAGADCFARLCFQLHARAGDRRTGVVGDFTFHNNLSRNGLRRTEGGNRE